MDNENKKLMFKNEINSTHNNNSSKTQNKEYVAKSILMEKYNLSSKDAEDIIKKLEKKQHKTKNNPLIEKININNTFKEKQIDNNIKKPINNQKTNLNDNNTNSYNQKIINNNKSKNKVKKESDFSIIQDSTKPAKNVDTLIADIIPSYNQQVSIEVNHVELTFEVSAEKIDTLKETFIRTLKRNKSKKIKIHALKDISFKIYNGEKVGIIGYNGAGKSTLLNIISGIYPPDKGYIKTNGNISPLLSLGAGFDYNYSGRKNIFLNGAVLGYDKSFLESKINEIIEFSELGKFIDIPIKNYSSGMLAKLGFSIATAVEPDILIIDEILGVGDVNFNKKSKDKIKSLMDGGTTVLFVSHSIPQVREICDKAIWIDQGAIKEIGEVNKVCDHYLKDSEKASNKQLANIQLK